MLTLKVLRNNTVDVIERLGKRKNMSEIKGIVEEVIVLDDRRKAIQTELDAMLSELNGMAKEIGTLMKNGQHEEGKTMRDKVHAKKELSKSKEEELKNTGKQLEELLLQIPNVPHPDVPHGIGEDDNEVYKDWNGDLDNAQSNTLLPHWELGQRLGILDMPLGSKITGSGFPLYKGKGAKLQRALISFFLDEADKAGFLEIIPPYLVNEDSAKATGQLPDKEGQMYYMPEDNFYLIPTAEVPITNIYRDETVQATDFPIKMCGYTPCFRREAGSYGADVKGLNRVHQFDKVEIVVVEHPEKSYATLEFMMNHVESLLQKLELPYRILRLCSGDLGFTSALTFDFEIYSKAQKRWLEVSSVSNFETYQSNRLNLKFKENGKSHLAHTLNGSALALARIMAGILENHQTETALIIPEAIHSYTGFKSIEF